MSSIHISNLTFAYPGSYDNIFNHASFQIDTAWRLGFCGRNGRGKTTFLKLLMGAYEYSGEISTSVNFEYFPFELRDKSQNTGDILQEIAPEAELWQIQKELSKLAVDDSALYRPFATLSNGEQTKALLAGLFLRENNFLLIDEPTNHLDMDARQVVARYLKSKAGFILVSHDRAFLDECVDHILSINKTDIEVISGNFSTWQAQKKLRDDFELAQNEKLGHEINRLTEAVARTAKWSDKIEKGKINRESVRGFIDKGHIGHQAAKMMERSKTTEKRRQGAIEEKEGLLKDIEYASELKLHPLTYHTERLLSLKDVSLAYDGRTVASGINFELARGDRLALMGGNGSGKSSLLKLICGVPSNLTHTGEVTLGSQLVISYVPQDASFLSGNLSAYANAEGIDETLFKTILRKLDFLRVQFEKDMEDYSAGQKKKVLLAASLCKPAHLYIWDEPLNYIDVLSRMQLEELILAYQPTMIFVEHDRVFCEHVANKRVDLHVAP